MAFCETEETQECAAVDFEERKTGKGRCRQTGQKLPVSMAGKYGNLKKGS